MESMRMVPEKDAICFCPDIDTDFPDIFQSHRKKLMGRNVPEARSACPDVLTGEPAGVHEKRFQKPVHIRTMKKAAPVPRSLHGSWKYLKEVQESPYSIAMVFAGKNFIGPINTLRL